MDRIWTLCWIVGCWQDTQQTVCLFMPPEHLLIFAIACFCGGAMKNSGDKVGFRFWNK